MGDVTWDLLSVACLNYQRHKMCLTHTANQVACASASMELYADIIMLLRMSCSPLPFRSVLYTDVRLGCG